MTKFKAGDKVRFVEKEYMGNVLGSVGTVVSVDADCDYLEATFPMKYGGIPEENKTLPYSIENLKLIEDTTKPGVEAKFEDVQVGDRVRLTAANGDVAEFKTVLASEVWLDSVTNSHSVNDWEKVEILSRAKEPLVPGLYQNESSNKFYTLLPDGRAFFTCNEGSWITVAEEDVRLLLDDESNQLTRQIDL